MCGVYGEIVINATDVRRRRFATMAAAALRHRGPDGEGAWSDRHCLLGHLRLAIIDLSDNAAQPMASSSGQSHMVYNGEIYNFVELRQSMVAPPNGWRSTSDTEVLLERLDRHGPEAIRDALGMFAVALWRPLGARALADPGDRLGNKRIYYARTADGALRFASEVGGLLAVVAVRRETKLGRLAEYLQLGYVGAPRTGMTDVSVVPPGCWLSAKVGDDGISERVHRYWDLTPARSVDKVADRGAFNERFDHTLRDAVRIRLRSDVPLGSFLSGGIDSSVVSLLASQQLDRRLRTFTVDFEESEWSEGPFAAEVARHIGTDHTAIRLSADALSTIPDLVARYGDLHGDSSALPTLALCSETRQARHRCSVR